MGNTTATLYGKILADPKKLTWREILRTGKKNHRSADLDYAMIAGTSLDTVNTETGMLQKWQQPWLYLRVLGAGGALSGILLAAVAVNILVLGISLLPALNLLFVVVPPCVVPLTLMVLFWELNAPRDISLVQLLGYFFVGGVLSLVFTLLLHLFLPGNAIAPVTEEPAKLLASLLLLKRLYRKNRWVFGFSGLALGAAVGAGFAAFESAQYAYNCLPQGMITVGGSLTQAGVMLLDWESLVAVTCNLLLRNICAVCGHVMYCAPYACVTARNMAGNGKALRGVASPDFWAVFLISALCHGLWNMVPNLLFLIPALAVNTTVLWLTTRYAVRRSFAQLAAKVPLSPASAGTLTPLYLQGLQGVHAGVSFTITKPEILIGSDPSCQLSYPVGLPDIGPVHAKLLVQNGGLYLADLGTKGGTRVNGTPVKPMTGVLLQSGDQITLGNGSQRFAVR